jgi:hypothetical protein
MPSLKIISSALMKGSADTLRTSLGNYWETLSDEEGIDTNTYTEANQLPIELVDDLRGFSVYRARCNNDYISHLEINPALMTPINADVYKPNFKIPCRLYANEHNSKGDKFWQTYMNGGTWGGESYPKLINSETVFYDCAFNTYGYYSKLSETLYSDSMSSGEKARIYTAQSNYFDYNGFLQKYQDWAATAPSEQALINSYVIRDYVRYIDAGEDVSPTIHDMDQMSKQKQTLYDYYFYTGSVGVPIYKESELYRNQYYGHNFVTRNKTSEQYAQVTKYQENIIFDDFYFNWYGATPSTILEQDAVELRVIDPQVVDETCANRLTDMYNISITFPRIAERVGVDPATTTHTTHFFGPIVDPLAPLRNIIANNNFSSKFIELIKDIDDGTITQNEVPFRTRRYNVQKQMYEGAVSVNSEKKFRTLKFLDVLRYAYNSYDGALNENYCFMGPSRPEHTTTYVDNTLFRFADNQNIIGALDDTLDYYRSLFRDLLDLDYDPTLGSGDMIQHALLDDFFNPGERSSEVLLYKVEKIPEGTTTPVQKFWIYNSDDAPDILSILDSQVKYGKNYTYKVYAYIANISFKYRYGDLRLTKQIGTIHDRAPEDGFADAVVEYTDLETARPDLYCMQFYDAETLELADQLFARSSTGERRDDSATADEAQYTSLAEYNTLATAQQDISKYPQLADFNLYIEPCWEIVEVPMFAKTLKVLDSPPNSNTTIPFQFIDDSHRIGFNIFVESFKQRPYPITINDKDEEMRLSYLHSRNLFEFQDITEFSQSPARYIEIYKTKTKPTSFGSFQDKLASTIDLRIENDPEFNFSSWVGADKLVPNTTYYYVFRLLNENRMPGPLSQIITAELVDDGGYIFSLFDTLDSSEFTPEKYTKNSVVVKKIFQLEPHLNQLTLDTSNADFSETASSQADNVGIGNPDIDLIWDTKFKIRLTSRKTGKKIDLNVNYKLQDIDYTMHVEEPTAD